MDHFIYHTSLIVTSILNLLLAVFMLWKNNKYRKYKHYYRTRCLTVVWLVAFGIGYLLHAFFQWRYSWATAASALTVSYFHIGALCFSWGYTPLLNPKYLTKKVIVRDLMIFFTGLIIYWTVAIAIPYAPILTIFSFGFFFAYAAYIAFVFYSTYNRITYRIMKMDTGNVIGFIKWMQACCDLIVVFGIGSVGLTAAFPLEIWPYSLLLWAGFGMFSYMVYSVNKYATVIDSTKDVLGH